MPTTYAIPNGRTVMDATTYTGTASNQTVVNQAGFKPDFVWIKNRSLAQSNVLQDSVRGNYEYLVSDTTQAENTNSGYDWFKSFNTNGFNVAFTSSNSTTASNWNASGSNFVGWQWQAGQGTTNSNTAGSITSSVSANTTSGFSVVTWTGTGANATIGHGLGIAPQFIITKSRSGVNDWVSYHSSLGNTNYIYLNLTNATGASAVAWNNTSPTSSVFSIGTYYTAANYVAYCWAPVAGFSQFGSYTGNGSSDGTFVYTGFRPKYLIIKRTDSTSDWSIQDTSRDPYNSSISVLYANTSGAEAYWSAGSGIDILSNGFKMRNSGAGDNASGGTYIYAAFAENPFKYANAR